MWTISRNQFSHNQKTTVSSSFLRDQTYNPIIIFVEVIDSLTSHCETTRGLLATDLGQETPTTPEQAFPFPNYHANERTSNLGRFNVHQLFYTASLQCR
ncbi:hypothetical protein TNCV_5101831 [Trichonephila clavipes]|nr:hypothetical protein TNCV_5101831 [Trichonephila clavipes]